MMLDLFAPKLTQKEQVLEYIKSKGRVLTHELNRFGLENCINSVGSRARELKAEGKIWHVKEAVKVCLWPNTKEEAWSILESDREY